MKDKFYCPENPNTKLIVNGEHEDFKMISIITPHGRGWMENIVCLQGEELDRFKKAVAQL